jgi:hypothetical protein
MRYFRPDHTDDTLFPLLIESLISEQLWVIIESDDRFNGARVPSYGYITCQILNNNNKLRPAVPLFSSREYAEEFRCHWDSPERERLQCLNYSAGRYFLPTLARHNADIVIDHGHQGVILPADVWRPSYERYGHGKEVAMLAAPTTHWHPADPDDFPIWRDRLTSLLRCLPALRKGWLLWVPQTPLGPRQLCLVTASFFDDDIQERVRAALSLLADDLTLPPLAYLPLTFGDEKLDILPDNAPLFYGSELCRVLQIASYA